MITLSSDDEEAQEQPGVRFWYPFKGKGYSAICDHHWQRVQEGEWLDDELINLSLM